MDFLLQEFNINILDKPKKENAIVYFLSTIKNCDATIPIEDNFTDKHLFASSTKSPLFENIPNYLSIIKLTPELLAKDNKGLLNMLHLSLR